MFIAPTAAHVPPFSFLLDDLPATPAQVARHLGVSARTLGRWMAADQAPRAVMLALFFESRWGRSALDAKAVNDARLYAGLAGALELENATLRARIARLERLGGFGSANAPLWASAAFENADSHQAFSKVRADGRVHAGRRHYLADQEQ